MVVNLPIHQCDALCGDYIAKLKERLCKYRFVSWSFPPFSVCFKIEYPMILTSELNWIVHELRQFNIPSDGAGRKNAKYDLGLNVIQNYFESYIH